MISRLFEPQVVSLVLQELLWYRCDLCDFDLCHHCLEWRAKPDAEKISKPVGLVGPVDTTGCGSDPTRHTVHASTETRLGNEKNQRTWFNDRAAKSRATNCQWELFRGGSWVVCGRGLSNWLTEAWQSGVEQAEYTATNEQKHLFDFTLMEQVILSSGKKRPLRNVLWEVELDMGWFLVEEDLAQRLRINETCGVSSFQYSARNMQYRIDIVNMEQAEQVNENLGTRRKLRKIPVNDTAPKMSRQQLRMALEDDFPRFAYATRQWLALRWPWQVLGDCSMDAEGFIQTGLADEIASGLEALQHEIPPLGNILQNMIWFDYVDRAKQGSLSQSQARLQHVVDAIVCDPRWRWGHPGAEDACSALWAELRLKDTGVEKLEFIVAGGLADELLEILSSDLSDLASVDDWIMEKRLPFWDGQDCAICFCPIGRGDVGRRMRCSCWLHFECLGHGLGVKISERAVDDKQMSICPACNKDLGRVIPPGGPVVDQPRVVMAALFGSWASMHQIRSLDDILDHFDVPEETWRAFEVQVGSPGADLRLLAALPKVALVAGCGNAVTAAGPLTPIQATQVGLVWRLARRVIAAQSGVNEIEFVDVDPWMEAKQTGDTSPPEPGQRQGGGVKERVLKMSALIDQQDDSELLPPDATEVDKWYQNFIVTMGSQPDESEEPTPSQLAALHKKVYVENRPPYCDFSVWVPFERRMSRVQKCRTFIPLGDGSYLQKDLPGPGTHTAWKASWNVFKVAAIMLNICSVAALEVYSKQVEKLATQWPRCWGLIYTADDAARAERLDKLRRKITIDSAQNRQVPRDWDPTRPWSCVFIQLAADMEFWAERVHHPAAASSDSGHRGSGSGGPKPTVTEGWPRSKSWLQTGRSSRGIVPRLPDQAPKALEEEPSLRARANPKIRVAWSFVSVGLLDEGHVLMSLPEGNAKEL
eukprot:s106_g41.t1